MTSREQFEAWFKPKKESMKIRGLEIIRIRRCHDAAWAAWQASREVVEVELPERATLERCGINKGRYVCGPCSFDPEYALGINHTIDWFTEALRTAGIRIKGESE